MATKAITALVDGQYIGWTTSASGGLRASATATETLTLSGRDVDGSSWVDFITITSANTPTCSISATDITVGTSGLHLLDTNASHDLIITVGTNLSADRTLTITTGDADRTFTISGDLTVESASLVNQDLTSDASPTFAGATFSGLTASRPIVANGSKALVSVGTPTFSTAAAGTAYSLTDTAAALDFGTTDPAITITVAGTYAISGFVVLKYEGATFAATRAVTVKLRRTNNTAADLTGGTVTLATAVVTTVTATFMTLSWVADDYTTAATDDAITIFADVAVVPTAGSLDAVAAKITARRIY